MHFDLTDLRLFLHVAEAGSITAGAARSGLALASASARVQGMEAQAGVALLERGRRGVEPTPAGRALLHHARLVTGQVERMRGELGEYARGLKGHVRLLANTAAAAVHLPEVLAAFLGANPNVDVDLDERPSPEVARAVAEGQADVGVAAGHADLSGLEVMPFRSDQLVLVVPRGHTHAGRRPKAIGVALGCEVGGL
jgi:DNA-binding transcriptional LysR family regulator